MPNIDFIIDDGEFAYDGVANYSVRKGCKGDNETPGVADAAEDVTVMRVDAWGIVVGEKVQLRESSSPSMSATWIGKIKRSRLLMKRLEELCQEDLERGSDE
jgi:hypothetical protein